MEGVAILVPALSGQLRCVVLVWEGNLRYPLFESAVMSLSAPSLQQSMTSLPEVEEVGSDCGIANGLLDGSRV